MMQHSMKPLPIFSLFFFLVFTIFTSATGAVDNSKLVYKGCAKQSVSDPNGVYSSALSSIFGTLIQQSSKSKFFKTTSGTAQASVSGLFQCRGDLSNVDCYTCVSRLPILMDKLCGKTVAARVQLLGCYMLYEVYGFQQISGMEQLYRTCGKTSSGNGFQERRDAAFASLASGVGSGSGGFYATSYESVYVLGQCQGDLGGSDCVNCVKSAVQRAQVECGTSVSGQIYLHRCFISYNYYPNGNNNPSSSSSSSSYSSPESSSSSTSSGSNPGRTVAIILGGAAGVGFIIVILLIARKAMKKDDDH